jgi:nematocidal protein AidA
MVIIDVLVAIDTETILNNYDNSLDPNNPVNVQNNSNLIYMVTKQENALSGQAGAKLTISAKTLDVIRLRATSLSLNSDSQVFLYKFISSPGQQLISPPGPLSALVNAPVPNPVDPINPTTQPIKSYFYNSTVLNPGNIVYHFYFLIVDQYGNEKGYYWWDTFITITD